MGGQTALNIASELSHDGTLEKLGVELIGSDLDATTQKLLNRGSKLTELLKQDQYSPMTVAQQVIAVFSGVRGFLDNVELGEIKGLEKEISYSFFKRSFCLC